MRLTFIKSSQINGYMPLTALKQSFEKSSECMAASSGTTRMVNVHGLMGTDRERPEELDVAQLARLSFLKFEKGLN
jgi:hypothetical protein